MENEKYRQLIRTYDLDTLQSVRADLDATIYPERLTWIDEEISRRNEGVGALPPPPIAQINLSREEGYAGFLFRFPALVADVLIVYIPFGFVFSWLVGMGLTWLACALPFAYPAYTIFCTHHFRKTFGKWLLGLTVTDNRGGDPTLRQCVLRHVPDLCFATAMCLGLGIQLATGLTLPEHGTKAARLSAFYFQFPLWDTLDDMWDFWLWSEVFLLAMDDRRRALHEFFSNTLVIHTAERSRIDFDADHEPSWVDWLQHAIERVRHPVSHTST